MSDRWKSIADIVQCQCRALTWGEFRRGANKIRALIKNSQKGIKNNNVNPKLPSRAKASLILGSDSKSSRHHFPISCPGYYFVIRIGKKKGPKVSRSSGRRHFVTSFGPFGCEHNILNIKIPEKTK